MARVAEPVRLSEGSRAFPKAIRLRRSVDYRRVQSRGRRFRTPHLLILSIRGRAPSSRFGLVVSRKVGNAVTRNRVKRWLREAIRHERGRLQGRWDLAIIPSPRAAGSDYQTLRSELAHALDHIGRRR